MAVSEQVGEEPVLPQMPGTVSPDVQIEDAQTAVNQLILEQLQVVEAVPGAEENLSAVDTALRARAQALVEKNPQLQPAWAIAIQDDVLTMPEAKVIVEAAGEKIEEGK